MAEPSPPLGFQEALDGIDFAEARVIAASVGEDEQSALEADIAQAEADASVTAAELAGRIQSLARADHYEGLLSLVDDQTTRPLLELLSDEIRRGAILHLDGATRRQKRFRTAATKHMATAFEALLLLDTTKARAEVSRIDKRWLDDSMQEELARLIEQTEDAAAERRELDARTAEVLRDHHPSQAPRRTSPRRAKGVTQRARGCASSALLLICALLGVPMTLALL